MRRLLLAGLYQPASGLSQVLTRLATELSRHLEVSALGFAPMPTPSDGPVDIGGARGWMRAGPYPRFGADPAWLRAEMAAFQPDVVLISGPAMLAAPFIRQLQPWRGSTLLALYLPMEGEPTGPALLDHLRSVDLCLTYTEAARDGLRRLVSEGEAVDAARIEHVGHGTDLSAFTDLVPDGDPRARREVRRRALPDRPDLDDAFITLAVARPYARKRLDLTVAGFARFAADTPRARLILHVLGAVDAELHDAVAASGVADAIVLSRPAVPLSPAALNLLYNAADVGLSTAMGEGWGLTTFEHAATGAAQIVPDHPAFRENWGDAARYLPCPDRHFVFYESAMMAATTPPHVADALTGLHRDPERRLALGRRARRRATDPAFRWSAVADRITDVLNPKPEPTHAFSTTGRSFQDHGRG